MLITKHDVFLTDTADGLAVLISLAKDDAVLKAAREKLWKLVTVATYAQYKVYLE